MKTDDELAIREGVIRTLIYFDLFSYPLEFKELSELSPVKNADRSCLQDVLSDLKTIGAIHHDGRFYSLKPLTKNSKRRIQGNLEAQGYMPKALKMSKRISGFPYVRAVMLSGSISKGYMAEDGDVDFFVITEPGRLWLTRTLLMLYKKIFLLGSHKYFCVNYLISADKLEIPDKNLFTATEIVTLMPTFGFELYKDFIAANKWTDAHYPSKKTELVDHEDEGHPPFWKKLSEKALNGRLGNALDPFCLRITLKYWRRKFDHFDPDTFELALRSNESTSKHHPRNFQKKVMDAYNSSFLEYQHLIKEKEAINA